MADIDTGRARTARGKAKRARIVDAAAALIRAGGVANTGLDAVLAASGASKSQLYHYFADKDDLVHAVLQRQSERVLAVQETYLRGLDSLAGLRRWRDAVVGLTRQDCAGGCPIGSLVPELAESSRHRALLAESFARWEAYLVSGFQAIQARSGAKPGIAVADLATAVLAGLQGGFLLAQATRSTRPLELALDMAIDRVEAELTPAAAETKRRKPRPR